jgi:transcriptional regulator with XRE-family HTH domain
MCPHDFVPRSAATRHDQERALREFGHRVRSARNSRGLTQNELADIAGVDRKTISRIENSRFSPSLANVLAIANALQIEARDLL